MGLIPNPKMAFIFPISCILALIFPILLKYFPKCEGKGSFLKSQIKHCHQLLYDLQHGFRSKRSCETQLVMLMEDLSRNAIKGQQTDLIMLDFSKAFDKVSHEK